MILFFDPNDSTFAETIKKLPLLFERDPISFAFIPPGEAGFNMKSSHFENAPAVLYKPKRLKFRRIDELDSLESIINDSLGGGGTWLKANPLSFQLNN